MQILRAKLYEMKLREQQEAVTSIRRSQVGTGSRSEKFAPTTTKITIASLTRLNSEIYFKIQILDLRKVMQSWL